MGLTSKKGLEEVLAGFWESLESRHSRRGYTHDWERYVEWLGGAEAVLPAQPADVQRYVNYLRDEKKAKPTRARALSVIRSVYDHLVVCGLVQYNPARSVKNPKIDNAPRTPWLDEDAARKLLAILDTDRLGSWRQRRDRLCVLLFVGIGWRRAEIARIRVEDISNGVLTGVVKGGKRAAARVPTWLQEEIAEWLAAAKIEDGPLLPRSEGSISSISDSLAYEIVKSTAERAGFDRSAVTPHGLRRTLATISGQRGASLKDRQKALAHASSHTTERYDHDAGKSAPGELLADLVRGKR